MLSHALGHTFYERACTLHAFTIRKHYLFKYYCCCCCRSANSSTIKWYLNFPLISIKLQQTSTRCTTTTVQCPPYRTCRFKHVPHSQYYLNPNPNPNLNPNRYNAIAVTLRIAPYLCHVKFTRHCLLNYCTLQKKKPTKCRNEACPYFGLLLANSMLFILNFSTSVHVIQRTRYD